MSNKRMINSRKAISPILATLLLVVIAVGAIVVTYAWINTYMANAGQQAGVMLKKANVSFDPTSGMITIDVQNAGTSDTKIAAVYIGASASSAVQQTPTQSLPLSLGAGTIATLSVEDYNWDAGETYYFRIVPTAGEALAFSEQAPL